jgi:hypothetical protein
LKAASEKRGGNTELGGGSRIISSSGQDSVFSPVVVLTWRNRMTGRKEDCSFHKFTQPTFVLDLLKKRQQSLGTRKLSGSKPR